MNRLSRTPTWALLLWAALMALIVGVVLSVTPDVGQPQTTPSSGMRVRQSGTDLGRATIVDCTTGVTCTLSGSVWTLTASGGGGGAPTTSKYILQQADGSLPNAQSMGALASGYVFSTTTTGVQSTQTATQVTAALNLFTSVLQGLVPASGGGTANFLRADGTWQTPAGGGNVSNSGTPTNGQLALWTNATTIQGLTALPAANFPALTGDITTVAGALATTLSSTGVGAGVYGQVTVDIKGRVTAATTITDVAHGGTNLASGTSGGILAYTGATTLVSTGALTANTPIIGGGAGVAPSSGTRSGNTTAFVTTTGTQTSGDCVKIDANGNHIANGSACGGGAAGITVYNRDATAFSYNTDATKRTVYSFSVAAGDLSTTKALRVRIQGNLLINSGSCTFTPEIKLGATVLWADATAAVGGSAVRRSFIIEFTLANQNATNVQVMNGTIWIGNIGAATTGLGDLGTVAVFAVIPFSGTAAEDTTGALTLTVSTTLSVSNVANEVVANYRIAELL